MKIIVLMLTVVVVVTFSQLAETGQEFLHLPIQGGIVMTCDFCCYKYSNESCHNAIDYDTTDNDTKVFTANEGEITKVISQWRGKDACEQRVGYGNHIVIRHPNNYTTLYAHLKYGTIKVKVGNKVTDGQEIATADNTGCSTGSHLHFEVRDSSGSKVNPYGDPPDYKTGCGPNYLWATCPPQPYDPSEEDQNQDKDNDGFTFAQGDCDDNDPNIHPQAKEKCNGKDDDCDGKIDENWRDRGLAQDIGNPCVVGKGECQNEGMMVCDGLGVATVCSVDSLPPNCQGKECGDNGCEGSCGECSQGFFCHDFTCQKNLLPQVIVAPSSGRQGTVFIQDGRGFCLIPRPLYTLKNPMAANIRRLSKILIIKALTNILLLLRKARLLAFLNTGQRTTLLVMNQIMLFLRFFALLKLISVTEKIIIVMEI